VGSGKRVRTIVDPFSATYMIRDPGYIVRAPGVYLRGRFVPVKSVQGGSMRVRAVWALVALVALESVSAALSLTER
jgi:hypothetical protein